MVRWLRPEFQNPTKPTVSATQTSNLLSKHELLTQHPQGLQANLILKTQESDSTSSDASVSPPTRSGSAPAPWPATLPEQVRAVVQVLASSAAPLTLTQIEARFKGKGAWKKALLMLVETLEALGRAQRGDAPEGTEARWRA